MGGSKGTLYNFRGKNRMLLGLTFFTSAGKFLLTCSALLVFGMFSSQVSFAQQLLAVLVRFTAAQI